MMGQQQQTMEPVAALRRIMLVVLLAALMAVTAAPALAANGSFTLGGKTAISKSKEKALEGVLRPKITYSTN
ncbi:MAG TPA: hypothetical protein VI027_08400 [Rubrobacteraceae bacterium]|jgi:hypothetical protein